MRKVGYVFGVSGGKVIDPENGMPLAQQAIGEVGAEKSGGAGYKNVHATVSTFTYRNLWLQFAATGHGASFNSAIECLASKVRNKTKAVILSERDPKRLSVWGW
jgi:hypothetical protein